MVSKNSLPRLLTIWPDIASALEKFAIQLGAQETTVAFVNFDFK